MIKICLKKISLSIKEIEIVKEKIGVVLFLGKSAIGIDRNEVPKPK